MARCLNKRKFKTDLYDRDTNINCKTELVLDVSDDFPSRDSGTTVLFLYTRDSKRQIIEIIWWNEEHQMKALWKLFHLDTIGTDAATESLKVETLKLGVTMKSLIETIMKYKPAK